MERDRLVNAMRAEWCLELSADPELWSAANPAKGHCDVSSFVAWEHLGGDLVLNQVFIDGELSEYHYFNRIDGANFDSTFEQFRGVEVITEVGVLSSAQILEQRAQLKDDVRQRIDEFRKRVDARLASMGS